MRKRHIFSYGILLPLFLGGCASLDGMPKPVQEIKTASAIPAAYKRDAVLDSISKENDRDKQRGIRNRTIAIYISATDARYHEFRRQLSQQTKGSNLGIDTLVLALSSAGAVAKGAANELSAGAAFLTGTRSALNKELYFEKTLPALISMIDTNRLRARAIVMSHLRDSIDDYPMELAFADLDNYQISASLDGAIVELSAKASEAAVVEEKKYRNAVQLCEAEDALRPMALRLNHYIYGLADGAKNGAPAAGSTDAKSLENLSKIATVLDAEPSALTNNKADAGTQADAIIDASLSACNTKQMDQLFAKIKATTGADVP